MEKNDTTNLIIAVLLTTFVFAGWNYFFPKPSPVYEASESAVKKERQKSLEPQTQGEASAAKVYDRLTINTPKIQGTLRLQGCRLDDLVLKDYKETTAPDSPQVRLLSPSKTSHGYFAAFHWSSDKGGVKLPDHLTMWKADGEQLSPDQPLTLTWQNGQGLTFKRRLSIDEHYMFTIEDTVENTSDHSVQLFPVGTIVREETPKILDFMLLHEGGIGYLNDKLHEYSYKDLRGSTDTTHGSMGGWFGISDKDWLTAFIPDQGGKIRVSFEHKPVGGQDRYQLMYQGQMQTVDPGQSLTYTNHFFAGAKILDLLDGYEEKIGMKHFDLAVDFGWLYIITKPIFHLLVFLKTLLGSFGLALLAMTVLVKALLFPLAYKSYVSMARMRTLQPKIQKIQERFGHDKMKLNQELMSFYQKEKVNPMGGCLPMLVQAPVLFALYKVLFVTLEMRHAPFYGWIHDLSAPDPTTLFNLFGLIPWSPPSFLMIGAWPMIMGLTMFIQQKLNPAPADPMQAKIFMIFPIMVPLFLSNFPVGLVIYWSWSNFLTIVQQWSIMRLAGGKDGAKAS